MKQNSGNSTFQKKTKMSLFVNIISLFCSTVEQKYLVDIAAKSFYNQSSENW